jgi:integrase
MLRTLKQLVRAAGLNCGHCDSCLQTYVTPPRRRRNAKHAPSLPPPECENWFLHKFRATYCTNLQRPHLDERTGLMEAGLDIVTVQKMMGHGDLASTMRYLRPAEGASVQTAVNSIKWR